MATQTSPVTALNGSGTWKYHSNHFPRFQKTHQAASEIPQLSDQTDIL